MRCSGVSYAGSIEFADERTRMTFRGTYRNGRIEVPEDVSLPEGAEIEMRIVREPQSGKRGVKKSTVPAVYRLSELAVSGSGRTDGAKEHDRYIYILPHQSAVGDRKSKVRGTKSAKRTGRSK